MNQVQQDYNDAINFAIDKSEDCELFMNMWRDGHWDRLEDEFGYEVSDQLRYPHQVFEKNTTVTVAYASGATREFVATDDLEKMINEGEMFGITTMHSDMSIDEEIGVSKMYAGNPMAAIGHMIMMRKNAENMLNEGGLLSMEEESLGTVINTIDACISFISQEITSHQSGMSPVKLKLSSAYGEMGDEVPPNKPELKLVKNDEPKCSAINAPCEHYTEHYEGELVHCTHPDNSDKEHEGNCTPVDCPLCTEGGGC